MNGGALRLVGMPNCRSCRITGVLPQNDGPQVLAVTGVKCDRLLSAIWGDRAECEHPDPAVGRMRNRFQMPMRLRRVAGLSLRAAISSIIR
jgi:hypothetical protein